MRIRRKRAAWEQRVVNLEVALNETIELIEGIAYLLRLFTPIATASDDADSNHSGESSDSPKG